uniref:Uncharacterized protein LOC104245172 n=1 Tax=Nicotiana sylvestris TaxID=4096 RepID=A0A1U7YIG1_NICSY|nr:PREDICTED: uncharacterized protein LOC104245172 [Nicotiana sylvestris]
MVLEPPVFMGANPEEDPQDFIDEMYKNLRVMRATETEGVDLAAYHLKGVAFAWFELWEDSREEGSPPARWSEIVDAFIDHFLPAKTRASRAAEFKNLKQGSRSVWEYHMEFVRLSKYVIHMFPTIEARVHRFAQGLNPLTINEASTAALNSGINYGKMVAFSHAKENRKLKNRMEREGKRSIRAQLAATVELFQAQSGQQTILSVGLVRREIPAVAEVPVPQVREDALRGFLLGVTRGAGRGSAPSSSPAVATSLSPSPTRGTPAPAGRGAARGGVQSSGEPSQFYAMSGCQTAEASPDKTVKFQWSDICEKSFQELKSRLTTAPVLTLPEGTGGFVVYCDASRIELGCVLMQHGKVVGDPSNIVPIKTIEVNEELSYEEVPAAILDRQVRKLRNKEIAFVKVLWRNQQVEEATWEAGEEMRRKYPHLFV